VCWSSDSCAGRILKESPRRVLPEAAGSADRVVTAKHANHVWHIDLTTVPTRAGFWTPGLPFALPQCWPFWRWLAVVIDHYSRHAMGLSVFTRRPTALGIRTVLGRIIARADATPKYLVCDKESIFGCQDFKRWCRRKRIRPRYGAVGQHGSIAVIERFIRTLKDEGTRRILIPQRRSTFAKALDHFIAWHNAYRPHGTLTGQTPDEVYFRLRPAIRRPRIQPRKRWPRSSPSAGPRTLIAGQPGDRFTLDVDFQGWARHLPIISLKRAA
jgi:transposase InsO family protein